jgi:chromosome segregation ATPase
MISLEMDGSSTIADLKDESGATCGCTSTWMEANIQREMSALRDEVSMIKTEMSSSAEKKLALEQEEDAIKLSLAKRMEKLGELRQTLENTGTHQTLRREQLMIAARETQYAINQSLQNVKSVGNDVGLEFQFLGEMQLQLDNLGSKLDVLSTDLSRLESRVFGRPPEDQIRKYGHRELRRMVQKMSGEVYIPAQGCRKGEHKPFFSGEPEALMP